MRSFLDSYTKDEYCKLAGHNPNTDKPEEVNQIISNFARSIQEESHE